MASRVLLVAFFILGFHAVSSGQMIVAHRGASHDAPENTLAAFELAWQQQSDGIEGDFYLTADNQIVCIHDRDTQRTTGVKRSVEQSTLAQLRELEYGQWKDPKFTGQIIPTLEQVLQTVPDGKTFVIELKSGEAIVPVLAAELDRLATDSIHILVIAFDQATVEQCKKRMPNTRVHWLTRFKQHPTTSVYHPTPDEIAATVQHLGADGVGMKAERPVIDAPFVERLKASGCGEFHVWTVDSAEDARWYQQLGVVGITTNRPAEIRAAIGKPPR